VPHGHPGLSPRLKTRSCPPPGQGLSVAFRCGHAPGA
jgi:hypothetical protein